MEVVVVDVNLMEAAAADVKRIVGVSYHFITVEKQVILLATAGHQEVGQKDKILVVKAERTRKASRTSMIH